MMKSNIGCIVFVVACVVVLGFCLFIGFNENAKAESEPIPVYKMTEPKVVELNGHRYITGNDHGDWTYEHEAGCLMEDLDSLLNGKKTNGNEEN